MDHTVRTADRPYRALHRNNLLCASPSHASLSRTTALRAIDWTRWRFHRGEGVGAKTRPVAGRGRCSAKIMEFCKGMARSLGRRSPRRRYGYHENVIGRARNRLDGNCNKRGAVVGWSWDGQMNLTESLHSLPRGATVEVLRTLTSADVALIPAHQANGTPHLRKIRDAHHRLAAMVAQGKSLKEINEATGYSFSRISILKSDPAFANLVEFYRDKAIEQNIEEVSDFTRRLVAFAGDCVEEMHDRLHDTPETIPHDTLTDWTKLGLDRIGFGAQSKSFNLNATIDLAGKVAAGRRRALELSAAPAVKPAQLQPPNSTGRAAEGGDE